jgi:hypothetical protein
VRNTLVAVLAAAALAGWCLKVAGWAKKEEFEAMQGRVPGDGVGAAGAPRRG